MYLWLKAAHIIFVVAWMAGLLVYPRYKIHQMASNPGEPLFETMSEAAARLRRIVMTPSMIAVWIFGISLAAKNASVFSFGWIWVKLVLVLLLTGMHGYYLKIGKAIDSQESTVTMKQLKLANELPFIALIVIVILVVIRPF